MVWYQEQGYPSLENCLDLRSENQFVACKYFLRDCVVRHITDISSWGDWNLRLQGLGHVGVTLPDLVVFIDALLSESYWFKKAETV